MISMPEKVANIMCFLSILFEEDFDAFKKILDMHPKYIIEKFEKYVESTNIQYPWGLHPILRAQLFDRYVNKWKLEFKDKDDKC